MVKGAQAGVDDRAQCQGSTKGPGEVLYAAPHGASPASPNLERGPRVIADPAPSSQSTSAMVIFAFLTHTYAHTSTHALPFLHPRCIKD